MGSDFVFAEKESKVIIFYLISFTHIGCPKKKCLLPFSAVSIQPTLEIFFVIEIIDKVLSLSKIWRHLVNAKIVKI